MKGKKKNILWWVSLIAGLFAINFIASKIHSRFDLTEEKRYSITYTTKQLVRTFIGCGDRCFFERRFSFWFQKAE